MVLAGSKDAAAAVAFESLFHHIVARQMCNWPMLAAYAFCWHELQPVFVVTISAADAYHSRSNALAREWNIAIRVPSKQTTDLVVASLSPEHSVNAVVNVLQLANWLEYSRSVYFYVLLQISVRATTREAVAVVANAELVANAADDVDDDGDVVVADAEPLTIHVIVFAVCVRLKLEFLAETAAAVGQLLPLTALYCQHIYVPDDSTALCSYCSV